METVYTTQTDSGADAFLGFRNAIRASFLPIDMDRVGEGEFRGEIRQRLVQGLSFTSIACDPVEVRCGAAQLSAAPQGMRRGEYLLRLQQAGRSAFSQFGRRALLEPGEFTLVDPNATHSLSNEFGPVQCFHIGVPRELLDERLNDARPFCALRFSGDSGPGRVALSMLAVVSEEAPALRRAELYQAVRGAIALVVPELLRRAARSPQTMKADRDSLHRHLLSYIDLNLSDPALSPQRIAEATGISVRTLFKLFESADTSVAELVRERRLERCRQDLMDRSRSAETITSIAFANGFSDAAHFSRSFKQRYGVSPRMLRRGG